MRNLKKILALALALVMTLSLVTVANAFTDDSKISADYNEAIEVLSGLGVFQGNDDGSFAPQSNITRAEVAAIIYRVATGDVTDANVGLYKDFAKFDDVTEDKWFAGYVNYCADATYVKGTTATTFEPDSDVTGYEVLAMILRAVGYDYNDEWTGIGWEVKVASTAKELGITDTVTGVALGSPVTREVVAELLFRTVVSAPIVKYTTAFGYQLANPTPVVDIYTGVVSTPVGGQTLGVKTFDLKQTGRIALDVWGRPGYQWYRDTNNNNKLDGETVVATFAENYIVAYNTPVTECEVAVDANLKKNTTFTTYTNGVSTALVSSTDETGAPIVTIVPTTQVIEPADTRNTIGGQGTITEVYKDRIIYIDTYLAQVTNVTKATFDAAGHLKTSSSLSLNVYTSANPESVTLYGGAQDYSYVKGNFILVQAVDNIYGAIDIKSSAYGATPSTLIDLGLANTIVGAQTIIHFNDGKHTINGTTYLDAAQYNLDTAANTANKQFVWFFDQYGNLIGSANYKTIYDYATIANIQWINPTGSNGYALATLVYVDGSTAQKVIYAIDRDGNGVDTSATTTEVLKYTQFNGSYANGAVSANYGYNAEFIGEKLFAVSEDNNGVATLTEIQNGFTNEVPTVVVIGNATVKNGQTIITEAVTVGDATVNAAAVYLDNSTLILVRSDGKFVPYVGYSNVPSLVNATVYAVNTDDDAAAEYVYIYGAAPSTTKAVEYVAYINDLSYEVKAGDNTFITLKGAYVNGEQTDIVVRKEYIDGAGFELQVGHVYYLLDANGNGKVYTGTNGEEGDAIVEITAGNSVTLADGSAVTFVPDYRVLTGAIQDNANPDVPYGISGATIVDYTEVKVGLDAQDTDVVLVTKDTVVSTVLIIDAL